MSQFMLFGGEFYYAKGGLNDWLGTFNSLEEALEYKKIHFPGHSALDWFQVFDKESLEIVARSESYAHGADDD